MFNKEILFRRRGAVAAPVMEAIDATKLPVVAAAREELIATASINIGALGYRFSEDFLTAAMDSKISTAALAQYLVEVIDIAKSATGDSRKYKPMYINFPEQVIDAPNYELFVNAMVHYFGKAVGLRFMPNYVDIERKELKAPIAADLTEIRVAGFSKKGASFIDAVTEFSGIFTSLLSMQSSWGLPEKEDVNWFVANNDLDSLSDLIPDVVPNKENLASIAVTANANGFSELFELMLSRAATATDVLRIAVVLSGGDASLKGIGVTAVRFTSQPKSVRRVLLARLEAIADGHAERLVEDMMRSRALWKLLSHSLHVGEYARRFPTAYESVTVVRANGMTADGTRFYSFGTEVEALIISAEYTKGNKGVITELVSTLSKRPGVFARRLDKVLRTADDDAKGVVIDGFAAVASDVATPVLWGLRNFYINRANFAGKKAKSIRTFIPKGSASKVMVAKNTLPKLKKDVVEQVVAVIDASIDSVISTRSKLGKIFINEELKNYTVPFGARSASKALNPVGRGTRVAIEGDRDTVRFFIFWKDAASSYATDIDLSGVFLDANFNVGGRVAYYDLKNDGATHSGDITSAPNGAAEYIDIDRKKMLARGNRYIAMTINSYSHESFDTLPELFAGVMSVKGNAQKGQIFEARNVRNAFDISIPGRFAVPLVLDLEDGSFIWTDVAVNENSMQPNNVDNNMSALTSTIRGLVESKFVSLYEVFAANAKRGKLVKSADKADTVIDINRGRVLINGEVVGTDRILSEWI